MKHPIVINECPKCGKMTAARSPYLQGMVDSTGKPYDENTISLIKIECFEHIEFPQIELKMLDGLRSDGIGTTSLPYWLGMTKC